MILNQLLGETAIWVIHRHSPDTLVNKHHSIHTSIHNHLYHLTCSIHPCHNLSILIQVSILNLNLKDILKMIGTGHLNLKQVT